MNTPVPRTRFPQAVLPPGTGTVGETDAPYPEPEFSRPLLFALLAILTLAQIAFEGIRFGLQNSQHGLVLPLLNFLNDPQVAKGDPIHLLAPYWSSPFWSLLAAFDTSFVDRAVLFAVVTGAARWASAVAIYRISERSFGHPLAALLAAVLWLGLPSVGGAFLHRDFLVPGDIALALLLWALVLWKQDHERWGLFCGLAACVDAPLGALVFAVLWCVGWLPRAYGQRVRSAPGPGAASTAVRGHVQALFWISMGVIPLWPQLWKQANKGLSAFTRWVEFQQSLDAHFIASSLAQKPWTLPVFLIVGAWCWKKVARNSPPARATSVFAWCLIVLVIVAAWLVQSRLASAALLVLVRAAPLAATLALIAMARSVERGAARRGSTGFLMLWLWAGAVVFFASTFYLIVGVLLIELLNLLARRSQQTQTVKIRLWILKAGLPLRGRDMGRWALIAFVLLLCWRGRGAIIGRQHQNGHALSQPQDPAFVQTQLWTARNTAPASVFLSTETGFRIFSNRAVFLDSGDRRFVSVSPAFSKRYKGRQWLAAPLWEKGAAAAENAAWLRMLRAYGVTHLVLPARDSLTNRASLARVYANSEWAIYKLR